MTDSWSGYKLGLPPVLITEKKPDSGDYYEMDGIYYNINSLEDRSGEYHVYPEGWDHSYRGTFIALANALDFPQGEKEKESYAEPDPQVREEIMTREHMQMSEEEVAAFKKENKLSDDSLTDVSGGYIHANNTAFLWTTYEVIDDTTGKLLHKGYNYIEDAEENAREHGVSTRLISDEELRLLRQNPV